MRNLYKEIYYYKKLKENLNVEVYINDTIKVYETLENHVIKEVLIDKEEDLEDLF